MFCIRYMIFKMRTKMMLKDRHNCWLKVNEGFNDKISYEIRYLCCRLSWTLPTCDPNHYWHRYSISILRPIVDLVWYKNSSCDSGYILGWYNGVNYWYITNFRGFSIKNNINTVDRLNSTIHRYNTHGDSGRFIK